MLKVACVPAVIWEAKTEAIDFRLENWPCKRLKSKVVARG